MKGQNSITSRMKMILDAMKDSHACGGKEKASTSDGAILNEKQTSTSPVDVKALASHALIDDDAVSDCEVHFPVKLYFHQNQNKASDDCGEDEGSCGDIVDDEPLSQPVGVQAALNEAFGINEQDFYKEMVLSEYKFCLAQSKLGFKDSYIKHRRWLVDWTCHLCENLGLITSTTHCAIFFLDKIISTRPDIPQKKWQLLCLACVSVACKYEEAEDDCPWIPELLQAADLKGHSSAWFRDKGEIWVLKMLNWNLRALPPIHFVNYYISGGVLFDDDIWRGNSNVTEKTITAFKSFSHFFCSLSLQNVVFCRYRPSLLASTIILVTRIVLNVEPAWRKELCYRTGYREKDIRDTAQKILSLYKEDHPDHYEGMRRTYFGRCVNATDYIDASGNPQQEDGIEIQTLTDGVECIAIESSSEPL